MASEYHHHHHHHHHHLASRRRWTVFVIQLLALVSRGWGFIGPDGRCGIHMFAPFTVRNGEPAHGIFGRLNSTFGHSMMIAGLLAAEDFNSRNAANVPELADLDDCNITLAIDRVFDTGSINHDAIGQWFDHVRTGQPLPCAFAGPYYDLPALGLGVQATAARIPMVVARSFGQQVASAFWNPFTTQVYPDLVSSTKVLLSYLWHMNRTDFIAVVHTNSILGVQRREILGTHFDENGIRWMSSSFQEITSLGDFTRPSKNPTRFGSRSYEAALKRVQDRGYRTIVLAMDEPGISYPQLANAAEILGMNNGDHFYVTFDAAETTALAVDTEEERRKLVKLTTGSSFVVPFSRDSYPIERERLFFNELYRGNLTDDFLEQIQAVNPIGPNETAYVDIGPDYFSRATLQFGSAFMYDSVMSIAFGACQARRNPVDESISGLDHHLAIQDVSFLGPTGRVQYGNSDGLRPGSRTDKTNAWAVFNLDENFVPRFPLVSLPNDDPIFPNTGKTWVNLFNISFIYAGNRTEAPLLRDPPDKNFVPKRIRVASLVWMSIIMAVAAGSSAWIYVCRNHRLLRASQPPMLSLVCFGVFTQASVVFLVSFDESNVEDNQFLSRMCMSTVWLFALGHIMIYSALFTKLWRVHKVLQFSRRVIKIRHVAAPMAIMLITSFLILVFWTAFQPLQWVREEINVETGESIGRCVAQSTEYVAPLVIVMVIASLLTMFMAFLTRDVDVAYSDSWWIFVLILVHFELVFVSAPALLILLDETTDASYVISVLLVLAFPGTTLGLIIFPKIVAYVRAIKGWDQNRTIKRGERSNARVTGIEHTSPQSPGSPVPSSNPQGQPNQRQLEYTAQTTLTERALNQSATEVAFSNGITPSQTVDSEKGTLEAVATVPSSNSGVDSGN